LKAAILTEEYQEVFITAVFAFHAGKAIVQIVADEMAIDHLYDTDERLNGEIFYTLKEAQVLIEKWRREYNTFRPHSSLKYRPPAPEAWLH
jgi:transposase InsO family protein